MTEQNSYAALLFKGDRNGGRDVSKDTKTSTKTLLSAWRNGDMSARDRLFDLLYSDLRQVSAALLRNESNASLSTGDLVNEAAIRLMRLDQIEWADKAHFLALAARAMRRVLIDHARKKNSNKRQHQKVTLISRFGAAGVDRVELDVLEKSLIRLNLIDPEKVEIVEMRYFGGMTLEDIAEVKNVSLSTVKRNWRIARAWLLNALNEARSDEHRLH